VANVDLENLQEKYDGLVGKAEAQGFNAGVFDGAIPVAEHVQRVGDPDEQVRLLLEKKGAFSASSLWSLCGSRLANSGVTLRAQQEQLVLDEAKLAKASQEKDEKKAKLLAKAQAAMRNYHMNIHSLKDSEWADILKWVLPEAGVKFLVKDYKKKEEIVAKLETLEKVWTSYIPPSAAVAEDVADNAIIVDEEVTTANAEIFDDAVVEVAEIAGGGNSATNEQTTANEQSALALAATAKAAKAAQARVARKARLLDKAQTAMLKYHDNIPSVSDAEWLDLLKWVLTAAKKKFRVMDYTTKEAVLAKFATLETAWASYIPPRAPLAIVPV
jgi:hypothetical protein